jgi:hypothetical protein
MYSILRLDKGGNKIPPNSLTGNFYDPVFSKKEEITFVNRQSAAVAQGADSPSPSSKRRGGRHRNNFNI